mgnify:CR=1 FL=1
MGKKIVILYAFLLLLIVGCSGQRQLVKDSETYLKKAINYFEDEKYSKAKGYFENIVNQYSGTEIAIDALYYLASCEYELNDFNNAKQSFKVYNRYSQNMVKLQSARFMICLCMFELTLEHPKDQSATYEALEQFQIFIEEYPGSKYDFDASKKIEELRNKLALKKYEIAKLYIKTNNFDSARIYLDELLGQYYDTDHADDARIAYSMIYLMTEGVGAASEYLSDNKQKFVSDSKYLEAQDIIKNSDKKLKIKKLYFLDYINKLL